MKAEFKYSLHLTFFNIKIFFFLFFASSIYIAAQTPQWELLGLVGERVFDIAIDDSGNVYAAVEDGVYKSTDNGVTWIFKDNGLDIRDIYKLFIDYEGNIYLAGVASNIGCGLFKSTNGGESWNRIADTLNYKPLNLFLDVTIIPNEPGGIIYVSNHYGVYRSTDNGITWQSSNFLSSGSNNIGVNSNGFMFFANNLSQWYGIYKSTNLGLTWIRETLLGPYAIVYLQDGSMLAGCYDPGQGSSGIFKSTDNGNNWFNTNTFSGLLEFTNFVIDKNNDVFISIIGQSRGVYLSTNYGISWNNYGLSNSEYEIMSLAIDSTGYIWAGTNSNGIYRKAGRTVPVELVSFSADVNKNSVLLTWITASELNNKGFEIERRTDNDWEKIGYVDGYGTTTETNYYSFTEERIVSGNYQYRLKQIDFDGSFEYSEVIEVIVGTPDKFTLAQNYPNPFNPGTKIQFQIPFNELVTLKVYDLLGREITIIVNEEKPAGSYEVEFDASNLSSGVYYYKLQAGEFVQKKKMLILR